MTPMRVGVIADHGPERVGSGFDSAATALLPCSTPRMSENVAGRTGSTPPGRGSEGWTEDKRSSSGLTPRNPPSNVERVAPRQIERSRPVCVCSLRTQQRAESQCHFFTPSAGLGEAHVGFLLVLWVD